MSLNLAQPIREAILGMPTITDLLGTYLNEPSIFTRRPTPGEATFPMIVISPDVAVFDQDAMISMRPVVLKDVAVYGQEIREDQFAEQNSDYRNVEAIGYDLREQFHRNREVLFIEGYSVIDIRASGPVVAPTGDDRLLGRVVTLTIRLQRI